jgi:hypothetical protein
MDKSIEIEILDSTPESFKVKVPFSSIPIEMNRPFLEKRLENGYFKLRDKSNYQIPMEDSSIPFSIG